MNSRLAPMEIGRRFPAAEALCAAAPALPRWKILKFRQRREPTDLFGNGIFVKAEALKFEVTPSGQKSDMVVFISGYQEDARNSYIGIALGI